MYSAFFSRSQSLLLLFASVFFGPVCAHAALELHSSRQSAYDLEICGLLKNTPPGETRYIHWADLRKLPTTKLRLEGEFVPGEQEVTVVFLSDLWSELPAGAGADVLLATCSDGYAAVYKRDFIAGYRPFLVLEINGQGPEKWPPAGLTFNPGPYVISISPVVVPAAADLLDASHKRPWGVNRIEVAVYAARFAPFYSGALAEPEAKVRAGRELWINSCYSCHQGPANAPGGTKSDRPFQVLVAYADYNPAYFRSYVRDPQKMMPGAKMAAHPHYTDAQLDELVAFITAAGKRP